MSIQYKKGNTDGFNKTLTSIKVNFFKIWILLPQYFFAESKAIFLIITRFQGHISSKLRWLLVALKPC